MSKIFIFVFLILVSCSKPIEFNKNEFKSSGSELLFDKMVNDVKEKGGQCKVDVALNSIKFFHHNNFDSFVNQTCWDNRDYPKMCYLLLGPSREDPKGDVRKCYEYNYSYCEKKMEKSYFHIKNKVKDSAFWQVVIEPKRDQYNHSYTANDSACEAFFTNNIVMLSDDKNVVRAWPYLYYFHY